MLLLCVTVIWVAASEVVQVSWWSQDNVELCGCPCVVFALPVRALVRAVGVVQLVVWKSGCIS